MTRLIVPNIEDFGSRMRFSEVFVIKERLYEADLPSAVGRRLTLFASELLAESIRF